MCDIVSIHVPARGTTIENCLDTDWFNVSIHVPARGTTVIGRLKIAGVIGFQSTFPHGERL